MTQELIHAVNKQVANWTVLYVKIASLSLVCKGASLFYVT